MKFSALVLGLLATSSSALLNQGANMPRGVAGDVSAPGPSHEPCTEGVLPVRTTTVTISHVKTIVDCAGHSTTGVQTPEASHVASATKVIQAPACITLSSVHLGWKGSHGASPTVATSAGTPVPAAVNGSVTYHPHTPTSTFHRASYGYNATTAAPTLPTLSKAPQETSGAISSTYDIGIFALVGFAAMLVL
ncbi:unnamed protein product [Clonostachys rosea]|uniref:Uncharacterized protein n=1 Tax=Bionectria ochroleuca TaxID=29856 RepID=A0ABY6UPF1_BIOOC|nr:unnamed protein product [Clonostachys rosea]